VFSVVSYQGCVEENPGSTEKEKVHWHQQIVEDEEDAFPRGRVPPWPSPEGKKSVSAQESLVISRNLEPIPRNGQDVHDPVILQLVHDQGPLKHPAHFELIRLDTVDRVEGGSGEGAQLVTEEMEMCEGCEWTSAQVTSSPYIRKQNPNISQARAQTDRPKIIFLRSSRPSGKNCGIHL